MKITIAALLAAIAVGCASAQEDRGNWTEVNVAVDLDYNMDGVDRTSQPSATSDEDAAVLNVADGDLAELARAAASAGLPFIYAPVEIKVSGAGAAESPGDTDQTPTQENDGNLEVPIVP